MIGRREVLAILAAASLAVGPAGAREAGELPRIGFLGNSTAALESDLLQAFREGLRELGYVEGRNVALEQRWAEGSYERLPALVAELLAARVDVIVTAGTPAALAAVKVAPAIPLVMVAVGDPIGVGLVRSLARPGGNATGLTSMTPDLEAKRLHLLRELMPAVSRIALIWNPDNAYQLRDEREVRTAAAPLDIRVLSLPVRHEDELEAAFAAIARDGVEALLVPADRLFLHNRERIITFARSRRLPVVSAYRELVEAGGLMSFGPSYAVMHRQAARFVEKILKGAKPAELPVEQPARFELVIDLKAAQALGLEVPPSLLARADEVIE